MSSSDDSGPEDKVPPAKKPKTAARPEKGKAKAASSKAKEDDDDAAMIEIGRNRFVSVSEFKGKVRVDIREYYSDRETEELKPGKKGISLSMEEWKKLMHEVPKIDKLIADAHD